MKTAIFRHIFGGAAGLAATATAGFLLSSCTTTYITPMAVAHPKRVDFAPDQADLPTTKTFTLQRDWQYGTWVMKKGATITFYDDGFGEFSCTVYSQYNSSPDELHFQSIQYAKDGNSLFSVPGKDVGMTMSLRQPFRDYPYEAKFAFNPRYFSTIHDVKFFGRLRLTESSVGSRTMKRASKKSYTSWDHRASRPERYPPELP